MFRLLLSRQGSVVEKNRFIDCIMMKIIIYISIALKLQKYSKALYKIFYKNIKTITDKIWKILKIYNMLKLLKMFKQIISQLKQMCLKLGLENSYTLTVSNFKRQFIPQKWPGTGKGAITKVLKFVLGILRRPWSQERRWWLEMECGCRYSWMYWGPWLLRDL